MRFEPWNSQPYYFAIEARDSSIPRLLGHLLASIDWRSAGYTRMPRNPDGLWATGLSLLLNLFVARFSDPERCVAVSMSPATYRRPLSYRAMRRILDGLTTLRMIERSRGYRRRANGRPGRLTRIKATQALIEMGSLCGVRPKSVATVLTTPIQLRDAAGGMISLPTDVESKRQLDQMLSNLARINDQLSRAFVGLHVSDREIAIINSRLRQRREGWLNLHEKKLRRIFNDGSLQRGGRFYGGFWQSIPREYRGRIHLGLHEGERPRWTVEVDYSAVQPSILYARVGAKLPEQPYAIDEASSIFEDARDYVKKAFMCMLNATDRRSAELALAREVRDAHFWRWLETNRGEPRPKMSLREMLPRGWMTPTRVLTRLEQLHAPVSAYLYSGVGTELQFTDSQVAETLMLRMLDEGEVVLPIHDSFLVRKGSESRLRQLMHQVFLEVVGQPCKLKTLRSQWEQEQRHRGPEFSQSHMYQLIEGSRSEGIYWMHRNDWSGNQAPRTCRQERKEVSKSSKNTSCEEAVGIEHFK